MATTNVSDRLLNNVQAAMADLGEGFGLAEGGIGMGAGFSVVSGLDYRHDDRPYVNQLIISSNGGPASPHCDGWITYGIPVVAGLMYRDSVEISELSYPIHYRELRVSEDTMGAGRTRGAPGLVLTYGASGHPITVVFASDGQQHAARGVRGGGDGNLGRVELIDENGAVTPMPNVGQVELKHGQWLRGIDTAGGGYGDPLERDPACVLEDHEEHYISLNHARDVYGVVFTGNAEEQSLRIDECATAALRITLRAARG